MVRFVARISGHLMLLFAHASGCSCAFIFSTERTATVPTKQHRSVRGSPLGRQQQQLWRRDQARHDFFEMNFFSHEAKSQTMLRAKSQEHGQQDDVDGDEPTGLRFPLPSLNQALCIWLTGISATRLFDMLPHLFDESFRLNVALNSVLFFGGLLGLVKSLQKINYGKLETLEQSSLAYLSGQWALNNTVPTKYENYSVATFAGGCFWGTELHYQRIPGVVATTVGYTQGSIDKPTYEQVCSGSTGHTEGIQMIYDPSICSYDNLVQKLLNTVDPTLLNKVGNDQGTQYRHGIYTHTDEQAMIATDIIDQVQVLYKSPIVTEVRKASIFWPAENYHQRYLEKGGQSAAKNSNEKVRCYG